MKILYTALLSFLLTFPVAAQRTGNDSVLIFSYFINNGEDGLHLAGSEDGFHWTELRHDHSFLKPTAGSDKLMRDPCIIKGPDEMFHMVWTVSWNEKGIGYATSKDLIHWGPQRYLPVMEFEEKALNCWAPELYYDASSGQYMIYWATTIPGRFPAGDTSGDGKYNHRIYYTLTRDFKTFSRAAVLYNRDFNVIDATIIKAGDQYVMFLKDETLKPVASKNIRIATSKLLSAGYGDPSEPVTGKYWAEGPTAINWKGNWIVYFDKYTQHTYGAIMSGDLKNWEDISERISMPDNARHGTVFKISAREYRNLKTALQ